jgi:phosphatidylglycerophosphate synthase
MAVPVVIMCCREVTMSALREWAAAAGGAAHKVGRLPLVCIVSFSAAAAHLSMPLVSCVSSRRCSAQGGLVALLGLVGAAAVQRCLNARFGHVSGWHVMMPMGFAQLQWLLPGLITCTDR